MRLRTVSAALAALALVTVSCSENNITGPASTPEPVTATPRYVVTPPSVPSIHISELHYDNTGGDVNERIEITGPAGASIDGWKILLYNGNGGAVYDTKTLTGTLPTTCTTLGVFVQAYPANGIQNGDPDGIALVDASNNLIEFISYEGVFVGVGGAADGIISRDIGVRETGTEPVTNSLRRNQAGTWFGSAASTFGACNDNTTPAADSVVASIDALPATTTLVAGATQQFTATARNSGNVALPGALIGWTSEPSTVASVDVNGLVKALTPGTAKIIATTTNGLSDTSTVIVNAAPPPSGLGNVRFSEIHYDNAGTDVNEKIEIEGPTGGNLTGWTVVLYNGDNGQSYNTQTLNVTIPATCDTRGVIVISYPVNGIQNGSPDGFALVNSGGQVVEFLSYEGTMTAANGPAQGLLSTDIGVSENSSTVGFSLQRTAAGTWYGPATSSFGACNPAEVPRPSISITGRFPSDPALPVGFQDQLFATLQDASGNAIPTTFTWSSETPSIATIDQDGVMTALAEGTAIFRATAATGETRTWSLPTIVATLGGTAMYAGNTEFGDPTDSDPSDDFILRNLEYTTSFSSTRNTPNWVSYDLDASHFGPQDRCDCFTYDPALPGSYTRYTTAAYTGAGAIAGYGIDRGHLARSFDRTTGSLDNAYTYYFTNIVPQAADLNQGPWAAFETYLGDLARFQNKEVYIVTGVAGNIGTLKNAGLIVIPGYTWKVAVIMPRDQGLANVTSVNSLEVIAVSMPNTPGIRNVNWETYKTTVDAIEALSGYDLLSLLPDQIEIAVESNTSAPTAAINGPFTGYLPGELIAMSGAGSTDADNDVLTYAWNFGDGSTGTGVNVSHAYAAAGTYTVTLVVTDPLGLTGMTTTTATILTQAQVAASAKNLVAQLNAAGKINNGNANSLTSKLDAAIASFQRGNPGAAVNQLNALLNELDAMVQSGRLAESDAAPLRLLVNRIVKSVT
ncbi:MAG: DNA/RNA non-specific endonuclease [Gemmatimonadaceae bacterium]